MIINTNNTAGTCPEVSLTKIIEGEVMYTQLYVNLMVGYNKKLKDELQQTKELLRQYNSNVDYYEWELPIIWRGIREKAREILKDV